MNRRTLLCGLAALPVAGCATSTARKTPGPGTAKPGDRLAAVADVPVGGGVLVDTPGGGQLLLTRPEAGTVKAFNPACPHQGTTVNPPTAGEITCPTHKSGFDPATGAVLTGPAPGGLVEVAVEVVRTDVVLA
ncbi:Rieske (2Fe-2S) protein [Umezawaea endophytica]|uniref:Rieske (2Fe-2S) protein n=1 Tax=Umezawaea endophytica TaxID=1654476 RepID=A0A9X2VRD3_9PSEU|nr:Rieske (2Fe-2S) protein [Umezawaea endophytica]MCS7481488.1 Rieske (2Fe-2S) protein [Umezawaea endophytica]